MKNGKLKIGSGKLKYTSPELEVTELEASDIITTSLGTETDIMDETDGSWEIGSSLNP